MKRVAIGALCLSLLAGSVAMAGQGFRGAPDHRVEHGARHDRHHTSWHDHPHHHRPPVHVHWSSPPRYHLGVYHRPVNYYPHHWRRGERLPRHYYAPRYVIVDYHACGLRRPPHGHHWVRVDGDAVLAAIATGVVLDVIYNRFY
jgi:Ni/Co efflux regulator RcnB